jgi:hypothetical protein
MYEYVYIYVYIYIGGKYIEPSFIVDIHAPCLRSLTLSLHAKEKKSTVVSSTFSQSNVLVAMKEVLRYPCFLKMGSFGLLPAGA